MRRSPMRRSPYRRSPMRSQMRSPMRSQMRSPMRRSQMRSTMRRSSYRRSPMRRYNYGGGKKKASHRSNPETDQYKKLLALLNVLITNSHFGISSKWWKKNYQQKYNAIKTAFNKVVTIETLGKTPNILVMNSESYGPIPGVKTGHTFMLVKLNNGDFGTIGFFPEKYRNSVLRSLFFGSPGILASPDPIARKQIKSIDNFGKFKVVYDDKLTDDQTAILSKYLASPLDVKKNDTKYSTGLTYEPMGVGSSENCLTFLRDILDLDLKINTIAIVPPIPNLQFGIEPYISEYNSSFIDDI